MQRGRDRKRISVLSYWDFESQHPTLYWVSRNCFWSIDKNLGCITQQELARLVGEPKTLWFPHWNSALLI